MTKKNLSIYASVYIIAACACIAQPTNTFPDNGNAGIGVLNPDKPLSIAGTEIAMYFPGYAGGRIMFYGDLGGHLGYRVRSPSGGGWRWQFVDGADREFFGVDYPTGDTVIKGDLNVGMTAETPVRKLNVGGGIFTKGPVGYFLDERRLALPAESEIVDDVTADGGKAVMRRTTTSGNPTMWYGPYDMIAPGNYLVQFRMKVASNQSDMDILRIDASVDSGIVLLAYKVIKPSDFRRSGEWQTFTLPITISGGMQALEIRGLNYCPGITDVYLDYINVVAGDPRGFYSQEITVTARGYVGIQTDAPRYPLTVNGSVRAKEIIVDTGWADDVFEPGYPLPSIREMERHIEAKKRLPGIPSATQVTNEGVNLGDSQTMLLRKIEELSLYIIQQNKRIEQLEQNVTQLESIKNK